MPPLSIEVWSLLIIVVSAVLNGAVVYGTLKRELRYMRRDINAAHRRLDKINAPGAWADF